MNKPKYFIGELDLFFYRRGAEGTEEEKKERGGCSRVLMVKRSNRFAVNAKITSIAP